MSADGRITTVRTHYRNGATGAKIVLRKGLLARIDQYSTPTVFSLLNIVTAIRDTPYEVAHEKISYTITSNLFVHWGESIFISYVVTKPTTGVNAQFKWVVNILDIDVFTTDRDGNRILDIYEDPDLVRLMMARDSSFVDVLDYR